MSITDELREYFGKSKGMFTDHVLAIADRIDAEHCKALGETAAAAYAEGVESVPIAVDESAWVKLPVDADGAPWHVGDLVVGEVNPRNPKTIERMLWYGADSGWQLETDTIIYPCPDRPKHHRAPTVEDVLRDFADRVCNSGHQWGLDAADTIAEFAARLRLAGDE